MGENFPLLRVHGVVTEYYEASGLQEDLNALGFNVVGYGCTTCIGNSGPIPEEIEAAIDEAGLIVGSVISGNRNFEGQSPWESQGVLPCKPAFGCGLCFGRGLLKLI